MQPVVLLLLLMPVFMSHRSVVLLLNAFDTGDVHLYHWLLACLPCVTVCFATCFYT